MRFGLVIGSGRSVEFPATKIQEKAARDEHAQHQRWVRGINDGIRLAKLEWAETEP